MSLSHRGHCGEKNGFFGKNHSDKTKKRLSQNHQGLLSGKKNGHWKGGKPKCIDCGRQLASYTAKRCLACRGKHKTGENHPRWKGGVTTEERLQRIKFRQTRQKLIFERDDYTCQLCGERGIDLQVDHIQPWADFVEGRFDMNNCRTLCAKCHYKITFGREMPSELKGWGHNFLTTK